MDDLASRLSENTPTPTVKTQSEVEDSGQQSSSKTFCCDDKPSNALHCFAMPPKSRLGTELEVLAARLISPNPTVGVQGEKETAMQQTDQWKPRSSELGQ